MGAPKFIADILFQLGRLVGKFSRKKTPEQQKAEDAAGFGRNHMVRVTDGVCIYCGDKPNNQETPCRGPKSKD